MPPPCRGGSWGSSVTSRSGDVSARLSLRSGRCRHATWRRPVVQTIVGGTVHKTSPPRHLLAITHAADTDTYIDTAHRSLPRYLTAADARWNKAKKRESAPKDKFATQPVVFQGNVHCTTDPALTVFNGIYMMMQYGTKCMTKAKGLAPGHSRGFISSSY